MIIYHQFRKCAPRKRAVKRDYIHLQPSVQDSLKKIHDGMAELDKAESFTSTDVAIIATMNMTLNHIMIAAARKVQND